MVLDMITQAFVPDQKYRSKQRKFSRLEMQGYETDLLLFDDITKKVEKYC